LGASRSPISPRPDFWPWTWPRRAWRVEVAHGPLSRSRRLANSFENTTTSGTGWLPVACIATMLRHLSRAGTHPPAQPLAAWALGWWPPSVRH